ncbi:MAG: hypothetical protein OCD76_22070 [Reichenbachiella sp.]
MLKKYILIALSLVLIVSTTAFAGIEKKKKPEPQIEKLLIIVLVRNIENRKTLEDELGWDFYDYGVKNVSSYTTRLSGSEHITKKEVLATCKKVEADGVLFVRLIDIEEENSYSYNQRSQYQGAGAPSATSSGVVITNQGSYSWGSYAYGNYFDAVSSSTVIIETHLYNVATEERLYTNKTNMRVGVVEEAIEKFSRQTTKKVLKTKTIKKTKKKKK